MAYIPTIPDPSHIVASDVTPMQTNFAAIKTLIDVNHVTFDDPNQGKHLYLQLPEHAAPATAVNEAGLYANEGVTSGVTELWFRRENNSANPIAFTERSVADTPGWTRLPSGIEIFWGMVTTAGGGGQPLHVVFADGGFTNLCLSVTTTYKENGGTYSQRTTSIGNVVATGFDLWLLNIAGNRVAGDVFYLAIGY